MTPSSRGEFISAPSSVEVESSSSELKVFLLKSMRTVSSQGDTESTEGLWAWGGVVAWEVLKNRHTLGAMCDRCHCVPPKKKNLKFPGGSVSALR